MAISINPEVFGTRGQAYLKALDGQQQTAMLNACNSHGDYQSVLNGAKTQADTYEKSQPGWTPPTREQMKAAGK